MTEDELIAENIELKKRLEMYEPSVRELFGINFNINSIHEYRN